MVRHAANSVIISFSCANEALLSIAGMMIDCTAEEKKLLGGIIRSRRRSFPHRSAFRTFGLCRNPEKGHFGGEQLIKLYLEQLLILLVRGNGRENRPKSGTDDKVLARICEYLEAGIYHPLAFRML